MYFYDHGMNGWDYGAILMALAFWALVAVVAMATLRHAPSGPHHGTGPAGRSTPEQVLAERFARGEIDQDDYYRRLAVLHHDQPYRTGKW